jgi:enamine deaminase RidA (YjgF/YER057c/UK114 family)
MAREIVYTPNAAKPPATYSRAVKAAGLVFVSGMGPHDPASGQIKAATIRLGVNLPMKVPGLKVSIAVIAEV